MKMDILNDWMRKSKYGVVRKCRTGRERLN